MKNHAPEAVPAQLGEAKRGKSYPRAVDEQLPDVWSRDVELRIRVEACGLCHSDAATVEGIFLIAWPRVPGDEVVGRIDTLGSGVQGWTVGQRVGVGFLAAFVAIANSAAMGIL
jgi:D-arabinose 1-dehydrogenase-like Zn-dependent alcohol dehydrogenase